MEGMAVLCIQIDVKVYLGVISVVVEFKLMCMYYVMVRKDININQDWGKCRSMGNTASEWALIRCEGDHLYLLGPTLGEGLWPLKGCSSNLGYEFKSLTKHQMVDGVEGR